MIYRARQSLILSLIISCSFSALGLADSCPYDSTIVDYSAERYVMYVRSQGALDQLDQNFSQAFEASGDGPVDTIEELIEVRRTRNTIQLGLLEGFIEQYRSEFKCHEMILGAQLNILRDREHKLDNNILVGGSALPWSAFEKPFLFRIPANLPPIAAPKLPELS